MTAKQEWDNADKACSKLGPGCCAKAGSDGLPATKMIDGQMVNYCTCGGGALRINTSKLTLQQRAVIVATNGLKGEKTVPVLKSGSVGTDVRNATCALVAYQLKTATPPTVYEGQFFHIEMAGMSKGKTSSILPHDKYKNPAAAQNTVVTIVKNLTENDDFNVQVYGEAGKATAAAQIVKEDLVKAGAHPSRIALESRTTPSPNRSSGVTACFYKPQTFIPTGKPDPGGSGMSTLAYANPGHGKIGTQRYVTYLWGRITCRELWCQQHMEWEQVGWCWWTSDWNPSA